MVTPGGEEVKRDLDQEEEFLSSIFSDFDRSVIRQVLKEFPTLDDAFIHLQEFMDLDLDNIDGNQDEEQKGAAASSSANASEFNAQNIYRSNSELNAVN